MRDGVWKAVLLANALTAVPHYDSLRQIEMETSRCCSSDDKHTIAGSGSRADASVRAASFRLLDGSVFTGFVVKSNSTGKCSKCSVRFKFNLVRFARDGETENREHARGKLMLWAIPTLPTITCVARSATSHRHSVCAGL
jgi:hypothetical protein